MIFPRMQLALGRYNARPDTDSNFGTVNLILTRFAAPRIRRRAVGAGVWEVLLRSGQNFATRQVALDSFVRHEPRRVARDKYLQIGLQILDRGHDPGTQDLRTAGPDAAPARWPRKPAPGRLRTRPTDTTIRARGFQPGRATCHPSQAWLFNDALFGAPFPNLEGSKQHRRTNLGFTR